MAKKLRVVQEPLQEKTELEQQVPENSIPSPQLEPQKNPDPNSPIALVDKENYKNQILTSLNIAYKQFCDKIDQAFQSFDLVKDGLKADLNKKLNEAAGTLVEKIYKS